MKWFKATSYIRRLVLIGVLCIIVLVMVQLWNAVITDFKDESVSTLSIVTELVGKHFCLELFDRISELELIESAFTQDHEKTDILYILSNSMQESHFDYIFYVDTDGGAFSHKNDVYEVSEFEFFQSALTGNVVIGTPTNFFYDDMYVPIVIPIQYQGMVQGQLIGLLSTERLEEYIESNYIEDALLYIVTYEGDVIACKHEDINNENQLRFIGYTEGGLVFHNEIILDANKENIQEQNGNLLFHVNNYTYYGGYYMTEFNDWFLVSVIEEGDLLKQFIEVRDVIMGIITLLFIFIVYFIVMHMKRSFLKHTKVLEDMTYFDKLTGLPNEVKFQSDMKEVLSNNPDKDYVIVIFDVVNFKDINDLYGMTIGDEVLCLLTDRINKLPTDNGFFGKGVSDEFWFFDTVEGVNRILENSEYFEHRMSVENTMIRDLNITLRYGAYYIEANDEASLKILENARFAHSIARKNNQHVTIYNVDVRNKVMYEKNIINHQETALMNREFIIYLQPKYLLENERVIGAEALVRWVQSNGEVLNPAKFIPIFEKNEFIVQLDMYVLEEVCKIIRNWIQIGVDPVKISVNFSRHHLKYKDFIKSVITVIDRYEVPREYIEFELTETVVSENEEYLVRVLQELHETGLTVAIDDFGSGYTSLGILRKMKFDVIKLDRSFLWDYENEERSRKIIKHMVDLAKDLNAEIIAEGVERLEDVKFLKEVGCNRAQGYFFAKPMIHHEFTELNLYK